MRATLGENGHPSNAEVMMAPAQPRARATAGRPLRVFHQHLGEEGPDGRPHPHILRVYLAGTSWPPDSDEERALLTTFFALLDELRGADLMAIPGLGRTWGSFGRYLRERLLLRDPQLEIIVMLRDHESPVSVKVPGDEVPDS